MCQGKIEYFDKLSQQIEECMERGQIELVDQIIENVRIEVSRIEDQNVNEFMLSKLVKTFERLLGKNDYFEIQANLIWAFSSLVYI